jgi:hypothetical protein
MSYYEARNCFNEILQLLRRPQDRDETMMWNLSSGLNHLSQALEADLGKIQGLLGQIAQALQHRR